jgi:hypothetical protein
MSDLMAVTASTVTIDALPTRIWPGWCRGLGRQGVTVLSFVTS